MEHRWDISADAPDAAGIILIRIARSWTGDELWILAVDPGQNTKGNEEKEGDGKGKGNGDGGGGASIVSITWAQNVGEVLGIGEEQGKRGAVIVCRMVLGCLFEGVPVYDRKSLWAS